MSEHKISFNYQSLDIENDRWKVQLTFVNDAADVLLIQEGEAGQGIFLEETSASDTVLKITCTGSDGANESRNLYMYNVGTWLCKATDADSGQSVKLKEDDLIMSISKYLLSFNLRTMQLSWCLQPDMHYIYEFYDLEEDILLRGELEIFRIDKEGNIKWSFSGRDIWVNINGKKEVRIERDKILLTDFYGDEYVISYEGELKAIS